MFTDTTTNTNAPESTTFSSNEKWGAALDAGYVIVPSALLLRQYALDLTDSEMMVILHILMAWREKDKLPFPRPETLAKRMGVQTRTVQRHLAKLAKHGWLVRVYDQENRLKKYDPSKLVTKLQEIAPQLAAARPKEKVGVQN